MLGHKASLEQRQNLSSLLVQAHLQKEAKRGRSEKIKTYSILAVRKTLCALNINDR